MTAHKRTVFWLGSLAVIVGVLMHFPDFLAMRGEHFRMAGMGMSPAMTAGMVLIVAGSALALWSVFPNRRERALRAMRSSQAGTGRFEAIDNARLGRTHWRLLAILIVGLAIDTMKPATLGFVVPGMAEEYGITTFQVALFPFTAITGTVVGSLLWGQMADVIGRRATLMVSGVIFTGTTVCGFMPSFSWNLVMCFAMGASAGGMLPTVYSLTAESVPARRRGALVVLQSGLGATIGYLIASGAATLLLPHFGWRALWLLGLPSGALLLVLCRWIPESPRFLLACGRDAEAAQVMAQYGITAATTPPAVAAPAAPARVVPVPAAPAPRGSRTLSLLSSRYRRRTVSVVLYGLGWGIVNWGFITFLPTFLKTAGSSNAASSLLFFASLFAVPNTALAAYLYGRWSSRRSMILYTAMTIVVLLGFTLLGNGIHPSGGALFALISVLLASTGGMIAMLSPYSTEMYPTSLRATGSGLAAAASKIGGMVGPLLLTSAPHISSAAILTAVPLTVAVAVLAFTGIETAGRPLLEGEAA